MPLRARERFGAAYRAFRDPDILDVPQPVAGMFSVEIPENPRDRYVLLELYKENRVYRDLAAAAMTFAQPEDFSKIRALENPALQAVQFGVMHVFSGPLTESMALVAEGSDALAEAAERILFWSNMGQVKDSLVEDQYSFGDVFIKSTPKEDNSAVYLETRHPGEVTDFEEDERRNILYIRLDFELAESEQSETARYWTEIWDKRENSYRSWRHNSGLDADENTLGEPAFESLITAFGHDYVPFVRASFEAGSRPNRRSKGVFEVHLEPIDQLNRIATELDALYRENAEGVWAALRNEAGKDALQMLDDEEEEEESDGPQEFYAHGRRMIRFPGTGRMDDLVPNIDYQVGLSKIEDRRRALERSMAELRYFRGLEGGDPSAAAIRQHQAPAIRRAEAALGNAQDAVLKALKMAVSMAQSRGLLDASIGTFAAGDFDVLKFKPRAIIPETPTEKADREIKENQVLKAIKDIGISVLLEKALVERGYTDQEARAMAEEAARNVSRQTINDRLNGG